MAIPQSVKRVLAPSGILRATINIGNPILASRDVNGAPVGVSVDLARELAGTLDVACHLVTVDAAADAVRIVASGDADVGFFAVDPVRGAEIAFTRPYILIEGNYLVREDSPYACNADVDRPNVQVAVAEGSAYDLFLTRELRHCTIVRGRTSPEVVDVFLRDGLDVAAGVKQQMETDATRFGGLRLLEPNFMVIEQAMGVARRRSGEAAAWLDNFVARVKANGLVVDAMQRHKVGGASVAS